MQKMIFVNGMGSHSLLFNMPAMHARAPWVAWGHGGHLNGMGCQEDICPLQ